MEKQPRYYTYFYIEFGKYHTYIGIHSNLDITKVCQTLFVHYIELFTISNVICSVNPQNRSWVLFTISRNSLYQDLSILCMVYICKVTPTHKTCHKKENISPDIKCIFRCNFCAICTFC